MQGIASTTDIGRKAEQAAKVYLEMRGFEIVEQNWRRPRCEIDIIAKKDGTIHFVEVKYRASNDQGSGFEAITRDKLKRMTYAARVWTDEYKWRGPQVLSAVELGGNFEVLDFIEVIF